jgi:hypothetical protein
MPSSARASVGGEARTGRLVSSGIRLSFKEISFLENGSPRCGEEAGEMKKGPALVVPVRLGAMSRSLT